MDTRVRLDWSYPPVMERLIVEWSRGQLFAHGTHSTLHERYKHKSERAHAIKQTAYSESGDKVEGN
jgi:hypothetical protein